MLAQREPGTARLAARWRGRSAPVRESIFGSRQGTDKECAPREVPTAQVQGARHVPPRWRRAPEPKLMHKN